MELLDKDLLSTQQVRTLIKEAKSAQKELAKMSQCQIDKIVKAVSEAGLENAEELAKMAQQETGFGKWEDKVIKNIFAAKTVYDAVKDLKTIGIISKDTQAETMDIACPMGVVAGLIPSTNPTSTVIYKVMIALKGGNSIVISPHPNAKNCILKTVEYIIKKAEKAGCPKGAIGCITIPTLQATNELMKNRDTSIILATGGEAMVRAAYSSGNPAIGVGPGNGPSFIDKSADVKLAIKRIMDSKTFDNGTICASEQSVIVEKCMENVVTQELKNQGAYILNDEEKEKLGKFIMRDNGTMNPQIVGKSVQEIAKLANLANIPLNTRVLVARETNVGHKYPYSREKLAPILAFYVEENVDSVLEKCREILLNEGSGHTFSIHCYDDNIIERFSLAMPVSRIAVNTPSTFGGIGASVDLIPALTLGCGAIGGSSTSNNVGPLDLINIKKVAKGKIEIEEIRKQANLPCECNTNGSNELVTIILNKLLEELKK
ncbi:acetaldehyde dehydrogenase (acetylating) [[Clostridium] colinum]|uniref:acetaldehyde dehydrogenase (acetylating) n=1 Tax=[Clostridium] colinum TaxID=36835 RepID=UPI002024A8AA|nr:acetaldehyde dehydrogenase (acetylating) [[Clostridium] colinum]